MPTPRAMFRILSVTSLLTRKALRLIIIPDYHMCLMLSGFAYVQVYRDSYRGGAGDLGYPLQNSFSIDINWHNYNKMCLFYKNA